MTGKSRKGEILVFHGELDLLSADMDDLGRQIEAVRQEETASRDELDDLLTEVQELADDMGLTIDLPQPLPVEEVPLDPDIDAVDLALDIDIGPENVGALPQLHTEEWIFSAVAGLLSVIIDVVFVGTPEVVKLWRGGEAFDGSILTGLLRKVGKDRDKGAGPILRWLSERCKVPYDISAAKGVLCPDDHRLKSLAHDPFFGLFFAVADILMGTTTCIGNDGKIKILPSWKTDPSQKFLAVFYYIGHLLSDLCTARGLPIPGAFLTQFFVGDGLDGSPAKIAREMYRNGYDLRHLASMAVPVAVKDLLISSYLQLVGTEPISQGAFSQSTEKEYQELQRALKRTKMLLCADLVATMGNVIKLIAPPANGDPCAIDIVQWSSMIRSGITVMKAANRDRIPERVIATRSAIDRAWQRSKSEDGTEAAI